jgi:choline-sulfatase
MNKKEPTRMPGLNRFGLASALMILASLVFGSAASCFPSKNRTSVIIISVDTLRADHLGCYGYDRLQTSAIDSLASGGTLFTQASAQAPLTLPSHVSLLTSTYPFSNGIEDNGEILAPKAVTLASVLKSHGYSTAAFIGGFALDQRFGLDQGFDLYDSPFDLSGAKEADPSDLKRPAEEVTSSAEAWLDKNSEKPYFLLLHLYDLHTPYQLPVQKVGDVGSGGYDMELQYVDDSLSQFLDFLRERGLFDKTLIVFLADHGESLGEHGEETHGYFIYQSTLHVPLIIHWPAGTARLSPRVNEPTSLLDVAPTVLQVLGLPIPPRFQGRSQLEIEHSSSPQVLSGQYSESLYAHNHYNCSPLRSYRSGSYKYIDAPKPELYDLDHDPQELNNLNRQRRSISISIHARLQSLLAKYPATQSSSPRILSSKTAEQLRALGYIEGNRARGTGSNSGVDPKDRIVQYEETHRAITMAYSGKVKESVSLLEDVLLTAPDLSDARNILGLLQQKLGLNEQAAKNFIKVLREDPSNALAHYNLAVSYFNLSQLEDAIKEIDAVLAIATDSGHAIEQVTTPAEELRGTIFLQQKDYVRARAQFQHLLTFAPRDFVAQYNLGWLAGLDGNLEEGIQHLQMAVNIEPDNSDAHSALGTIYLHQDNLTQAHNQFLEAERLNPDSASAHYNLGVVLARENNSKEAVSEFRQALKVNPGFSQAREALDKMEVAK